MDALRDPAGLEEASGPAITVTLDDAPQDVIESSDQDANLLVVHRQDIQAVANALWAGGAEAMTIQGQRVISTTGIKCVGNTVVLHGIPYSPPYVITAVGDPSSMYTSLDENPYIQGYQDLGGPVRPRLGRRARGRGRAARTRGRSTSTTLGRPARPAPAPTATSDPDSGYGEGLGETENAPWFSRRGLRRRLGRGSR